MRFLGSLCVLIAMTASACKSTDGGSRPADTQVTTPAALGMNDVSIFFPLHLVPGLAARMPHLSDRPESPVDDDGQAFVPSFLQSRVQGGLIRDVGAMQMTALRFDPCANVLDAFDHPEKCVAQIRIVWQSFTVRGEAFLSTADTGLHAVYQVDQIAMQQIIETMRTLKSRGSIDTSASPLQPHPLIAAEGLQSPYLAGVLGLVHRYVRGSKLTNLAFLRRIDERFPTWEMSQLAVQGEVATYQNIPTTVTAASIQRFRAETPILDVDPKGTTPFKLTVPFVPPGRSSTASEEERLVQPLISTLAIDNPQLHNPLNLDCGSCHRTAPLLAARLEAQAAGRLIDDPHTYRAEGRNLTARVPKDPFSLHMFSYFEQFPVITQRTVNETAEVLRFIEAHPGK